MKERKPQSLPDALFKTFAALGMDTAAEILGKSPQWCYQLADPDSDHWPNIRQCMALSVAYINGGHGPCPVVTWFNTQVEERTGKAPKMASANLFDSLRSMTKEVAEGAVAMTNAIEAGGRLSRREHGAIEQELVEAVEATAKALRDFRSAYSAEPITRMVPRSQSAAE